MKKIIYYWNWKKEKFNSYWLNIVEAKKLKIRKSKSLMTLFACHFLLSQTFISFLRTLFFLLKPWIDDIFQPNQLVF